MPTPFPFEPDGSKPILEHLAYQTDVMTADDGTEQRRIGRLHEIGALEFDCLEQGQLAQYLNATLYANQPDQWAVPLWPYRTYLTFDSTPGDPRVYVANDAVFLDYDLGHNVFALVWADPIHWELLSVVQGGSSITPNSLTLELSVNVAKAWPAGTAVIPIRLARLTSAQKLSWFGQDMLGAPIVFDWENTGPGLVGLGDFDPANDPDFAAGVYGHLGSEPGRLIPLDDTYLRGFRTIGGPLGARENVTMDAQPRLVRPFLWQGDNRFFMRGWLGIRKGRALPFWLWPYEREVTAFRDHDAGDTTVYIDWMDYAAKLWPGSNARRWLHIRWPDGQTQDVFVSAADEDDPGIDEGLTLADPLDRAIDRSTLIGFRRFCRLDTDEVTLEHHGPTWTEATLRIRELPLEAPGGPT